MCVVAGPGDGGGVVRLVAGLGLAPQQPPVHVTLASYSVTAPPPARHSHTLDTTTRGASRQTSSHPLPLSKNRLLSDPLFTLYNLWKPIPITCSNCGDQVLLKSEVVYLGSAAATTGLAKTATTNTNNIYYLV